MALFIAQALAAGNVLVVERVDVAETAVAWAVDIVAWQQATHVIVTGRCFVAIVGLVDEFCHSFSHPSRKLNSSHALIKLRHSFGSSSSMSSSSALTEKSTICSW